MAPPHGNQFLQLDPEQKRRASSRVTDPLSLLALLDASSPKGGAFCHLPVSTDKAPLRGKTSPGRGKMSRSDKRGNLAKPSGFA